MKPKTPQTVRLFLAESQHSISEQYLPPLLVCLATLSDTEIWWRPNASSNSVGNLVLHLSGNIRQWIISGLGGTPDTRDRDSEFSERGPIPRGKLAGQLRETVLEACGVLKGLSGDSLTRSYVIQGFHVTGHYAVFQVVEHFAYHAGQIIYVTKLKHGKDLGFTRLPAKSRKRDAV